MDLADPQLRRSSRGTLACVLAAVLAVIYVALPEDAPPEQVLAEREDDEDSGRLEIVSVSPHDPYPGSTIAIVHSPARHQLSVYAGKRPLRVLVRRPGEMVAELPRDVPAGDLKIRVASAESVPFHERSVRSKPYHLRVRTPNYRKVFRSLIGGAALIVLGIGVLSRGVRESTGLHTARLLTRATRRRTFVLGFGALLGAIAQTTTGAAGVVAALASSRVLAVAPAAIAFLGAPLGAALAPLAVAGLVEPREGLIAVAIGVLGMVLTHNRRSQAIARLVLGTGFVAFGLQVFRPGLEPFFSDAMLWSLAEQLRTASVLDLLMCAALGSVAVAGLHGPAPLIVLVLGVAQATGHWDLRTSLALLSGTGLGACLAALITAPAGPESRALARLNLYLGTIGTVLGVLSVDLWVALAELVAAAILGPLAAPLHWTTRVPMVELGLRLGLGFGASQIATAFVLLPLAPRLAGWLERQGRARRVTEAALPEAVAAELRGALDRAMRAQSAALSSVVALALTGVRKHGEDAEQALAEARETIAGVLAGPVRQLPPTQEAAKLGGAAFAALQLENALDFLLRETERLIDARVVGPDAAGELSALSWDDETLLRSLHRLVSEGLEAARASLIQREPLDLESARAREIRINRIDADARRVLLEAKRPASRMESYLHVLQVVDAYEVSGNQIYRLAETLGRSSPIPSVASA